MKNNLDLINQLDAFTRNYIIAALWSTVDDCGTPLDENFGLAHFSEECLSQIKKDCEEFQENNSENLELMSQITGGGDDYNGHDFWLTRNRHGAGFWDRGAGEIGEKLSEAAKAFGEVDFCVGDDGKIY